MTDPSRGPAGGAGPVGRHPAVRTASAPTRAGGPVPGRPSTPPVPLGVPSGPVPSRHDSGLTRPLVSERYCRVTVVLPGGGRITVSLPSRTPVADVTDLVVRDLQLGDVMLPAVWTLGEPGRPAIPLMSTLSDAGVLDGAVLEVRDQAFDEVGEPLVLEVPEMLADAEDRDGRRRWNTDAAVRGFEPVGYVGLVIASLAGLLVPAAGGGRTVLGLVTVVAGLLLLTAANLRHRGSRPSAPSAVLAAWCAVAVLAVAARYSATPHDLVVRVAGGAVLAGLLACAAAPVLAVVGPASALVVAGVATAALVGGGAEAVQSAATVGVLGALLVALAPAVAGRLAAMVPVGSDGAAPIDRVRTDRVPAVRRAATQAGWERAMRSRISVAVGQVHVVFVTACVVGSVAVVVSEIELARAGSVYALVESGVLAVVLLLRAVPARRAADGAVLLAGGAGAVLVVVALLPGRWWPAWAGPVLAIVLTLGLAAAGVIGGEVIARRGGRTGHEPVPRGYESAGLRAVRILSVALLIVAVVLTVGTFDVFTHFWHLGRSL